jgi:putative hydrolase of the HAD superfamily
MKNKLVIFDCFGVIMGEIAPVFLRKFLPEDVAAPLKEKLFVPADLGQVTYDELLTNMAEALGIDKEEMMPQWEELFVLQEEIVPVIKRLRETYNVALLSNAPLGVVEGILDKYGLWDLFEQVVVSCNVKMAKPDEKIYKHCISLFDKNFDEVYMIDDSFANLEHLPEIGIKTIHYKSIKDLDILF